MHPLDYEADEEKARKVAAEEAAAALGAAAEAVSGGVNPFCCLAGCCHHPMLAGSHCRTMR